MGEKLEPTDPGGGQTVSPPAGAGTAGATGPAAAAGLAGGAAVGVAAGAGAGGAAGGAGAGTGASGAARAGGDPSPGGGAAPGGTEQVPGSQASVVREFSNWERQVLNQMTPHQRSAYWALDRAEQQQIVARAQEVFQEAFDKASAAAGGSSDAGDHAGWQAVKDYADRHIGPGPGQDPPPGASPATHE